MIDWSQMKTKEMLEEEACIASRIMISRTQGLIWMFRNKGVEDTEILSVMEAIPIAEDRYEAKQYFMAANWESDNPYVQLIGKTIGLDTLEKLQEAFQEAKEL